jgi:hypothetical protein
MDGLTKEKCREGAGKRLYWIVCSVMKDEIAPHLTAGDTLSVLPHSLHRTPDKMRETLQEEILKADTWEGDAIILGYGLCSNGAAGLRAGRHSVVIPRVHDCISLFLGSATRYLQEHGKEPGTYFLTRGWIDEKKTPLYSIEEYAERFDRETAEWVIREELKNYTRIALVDSGLGLEERHRAHALETSRFLGLRLEELKGSLALFQKMAAGPWDGEFVVLNPGEESKQEAFLGL